MRLYVDLCCLNRPFDEQTHPRVIRETIAITRILERCAAGEHELCASAALWVENAQNPDREPRMQVAETLSQAPVWIPHDLRMDERVVVLRSLGFKEFDAYHVA